jgi:hypothetical protein
MKAVVLLFLFFPFFASAQETWEDCMDHGDFRFSADSFLKSHRMAKDGCVMTFIESGGKGSKYELNLCDANIHVAEFDALDSDKSTSHFAGSGGCPAPLFGADFGLTKKGGEEFTQDKKKVMEIFRAVKKVFGPTTTPAEASKIRSATPHSEAKIACAELLMIEYLEKCTAFEMKPEAPKEKGPLPPGVHPAEFKR